MGYQQGSICFRTEAEAANALMTQVVPTIDKDGVIHHPVFNGRTWEYQGKTVALTFPQCEYGRYYKLGETAGTQILEATAALVCTIILIKAIGQIR